MSCKTGPYHNPFTNLAAAIIKSGVEAHDTYFLESEWCDDLKEMCRLDDDMYGHRGMGPVRGMARLSKEALHGD